MRVNADYSRNFLIAASAYRRHARGFTGDFSATALREQYEHETFGKPVSSNNGYACGKKFLGVTLAAMREDIAFGLFCKQELMQSSCAFVRREVRNLMPSEFFGFIGELKCNNNSK